MNRSEPLGRVQSNYSAPLPMLEPNLPHSPDWSQLEPAIAGAMGRQGGTWGPRHYLLVSYGGIPGPPKLHD